MHNNAGADKHSMDRKNDKTKSNVQTRDKGMKRYKRRSTCLERLVEDLDIW